MPKKATKKARTPTLAQTIKKDLREKKKTLARQLARVHKDLRSLGVQRKKYVKKA